jgi:hypothetical protein
MSRDDKFFQFPVSALRMSKPITEITDAQMSDRCYDIIFYGMIAAGFKVEEELQNTLAEQHDEFDEYLTDWQIALLAGAATIGVNVKNIKHPNRIASYRKIVDAHSKQLRLKRELMFEFAELKNGMSYREFATLCGVLAGVGAHKHTRLSFDYIAVLAAGYSSMDTAKKARAKLADRHVIRWTVHKLIERGLFSMVSLNKRHNVYSVALNLEALAAQLFARAEKQVQRDSSVVSRSLQKKIADLKQAGKQAESQRQKVIEQLRIHG